MPYEIITIPFSPGSRTFNADDLNRFCANKKVLNKKIEFFKDNEYNYWTVFLEYDPILNPSGRDSSGLNEAGKVCYRKLREWRKLKAENEGIPAFVIAKNSQLAEIVKMEPKTLEALKQINNNNPYNENNNIGFRPASTSVFLSIGLFMDNPAV